jgi:hypothetical protein
MSATARCAQFLSLMVLAAVQLGCGPGDGKTDIEGTATWNGEPISDGYVELTPVDGSGQIDGADIVNGKFTVRTTEGEKVARVSARRKIGETPATPRMPAEPIYHEYIPNEFNSKSALKVTINTDDPTLKLDLKGKDAPQGESAADRARRQAYGAGN